MGLFDWIKGTTLLEVIEWTDDSANTLVYRYPTYDKMIKWGAQLTVREGQTAIFIVEGKLADVFPPGRHMLSTKNLPILTAFVGLPFGATTPFKSEIYYVNMREFTNLKWGTPNPIMMKTTDAGPVRIRGFGTYTFKVADPAKLLKGLVGTQGRFTTDGIMEQLRSFVVQKFADHLGEAKIALMDAASQYNEIAAGLLSKVGPEFLDYGLTMVKFVVENITVPEEVEKALDERGKMGMIGDLDAYTKMKAAEAMGDAAKNPGGAAGAGMGIGAGFIMAQRMADAQAKPSTPSSPTLVICPSCKQMSNPGNFCQHCGQPIARANQCAACKTEIPATSKFCPSCGAKVV